MRRALALAASVRTTTSPNPWVGCVLATGEGCGATVRSQMAPGRAVFEGVTQPPGGLHAEAMALDAAGPQAQGATLVVTLEPCAHHGRTPPCVDAIVAAGVARVVVGIEDPDPHVNGRGIQRLRQAGIEVEVGVCAEEVSAQLAPYLKHRRYRRPWVVLALVATLDGRIATPDGGSQWITGPAARADAHRLRTESDAVLVGAGTAGADGFQLPARSDGLTEAAAGGVGRQPLRVMLGTTPVGARLGGPALELTGDLGEVLDELGRREVMQLLVEGGATVAGAFHRARLVDRYVIYLAPALMGGDGGCPMLAGPGAHTMAEVWRGRIVSVERLGDDLRVELAGRAEHARPA